LGVSNQLTHKNKVENPGLAQQEQTKTRKHAEFYAPIGFAFLSFPVLDHLGLSSSMHLLFG
jgi:hypothetical protein